jgi:hypothetical protein
VLVTGDAGDLKTHSLEREVSALASSAERLPAPAGCENARPWTATKEKAPAGGAFRDFFGLPWKF